MLKREERKLKDLTCQKVNKLKYPAELTMFCRDCQNSLINVLQKYRSLETAYKGIITLLDEKTQEAKSWEEVYMDLTEVMKERNEVIEILRNENKWNAWIIDDWEERKKLEVKEIDCG